MKKLHKNFRSMKQTVESMGCECSCSCSTICNCTDISNYYGYVAIGINPEASFGVSHMNTDKY